MDVITAVQRLAGRGAARTEADVQADLYLVLTSASLALDPGEAASSATRWTRGTWT